MPRGLVQIYYGNGKGKTTAAVGAAVRAAGAGLRVAFAQFLKDGSSSECIALQALDGCTVLPCPQTVSFTFCMSKAERDALAQYYTAQLCELQALCGRVDLLVLDEVLDAVAVGLLAEEALITFVQTRADGTELILTGHTLSPAMRELADYLTEMSARRHPYDHGVAARRGIEY